METNKLLSELLESGRTIAEQGQQWLEDKAGVPHDEADRQTTLEAMGKGAVGAGVLALLLGTGTGRRVTGSALKLGSLAALGGLAYKTFQGWQGVHSTKAVEQGSPVDQLADTDMESRSRNLLKAVIAAAKADGHIDDDELSKIREKIATLGLDSDSAEFIKAELAKPLSASDVASGSDSPTTAAEIYLISYILMDEQNAQEKAYLHELAQQLGLKPTLVAELERKMQST